MAFIGSILHGFASTEIIAPFLCLELSVPLLQMVTLLFLTTIALLFGKLKLSLLINYVFTFYWGYVFNKKMLFEFFYSKVEAFAFMYFYVGFGLLVLIFALIGFLSPK